MAVPDVSPTWWAQAPVHGRLSAVRAELGALRPCSEPARAHRLPGRTEHRRGAALLRHQYRRRGRVLVARLAARGPHRLRPQHSPRRSAAVVGGGPRRDCSAGEFRCHGGRDLARTSVRAAALRRKGCVGLTGNRMASFAPDPKIARAAGTTLNRSEIVPKCDLHHRTVAPPVASCIPQAPARRPMRCCTNRRTMVRHRMEP